MFKFVAVLLLTLMFLFAANSLTVVDTARTVIYLLVGMFALVGFWYASME